MKVYWREFSNGLELKVREPYHERLLGYISQKLDGRYLAVIPLLRAGEPPDWVVGSYVQSSIQYFPSLVGAKDWVEQEMRPRLEAPENRGRFEIHFEIIRPLPGRQKKERDEVR